VDAVIYAALKYLELIIGLTVKDYEGKMARENSLNSLMEVN